ncbi:MAG: hypothetical protein ACKVTZ_20110 [Bacteroidia bacterium]
MKQLLTILLLSGFTAMFAQPKTGYDFKKAGDYNNFIVEQQQAVTLKNIVYISKAAHSKNDNKIEARRNELVAQIKEGINKVSKMPTFEGDETFKTKALDYFETMLNIFNGDYKEINQLSNKVDENQKQKKCNDAVNDIMQQYLDLQTVAETKLATASDEMDEAQVKFAEKQGMTLKATDDGKKMGKLIAQISEVNVYHRQIDMEMFKNSTARLCLSAAWDAKNVAEFEESRTKLLEASEASLAEIKKMSAFKGDDSYLQAAKTMLFYFSNLAKGDFVKVGEFLAKEQKDVTKADVDTYNKIIQSYNKKNAEVINDYNKAMTHFMEKHIPKA